MMRSAGLAVLASMVVIGAGYLLQLGLGRAVVPAEFQFLQESLAFYMISMLPLQPIASVITKQSAQRSDGLWNDVTPPWLIGALMAATAGPFASARGSAPDWDASTLSAFLLAVFTGIALLITNAVVLGRLDFAGSAVVQTIQASLRLGLAIPLVWHGAGGRGLWCATALANGSAALCAKWRSSGTRLGLPVRASIPSRTLPDLAIAIACYAGLAVLTQIDLIYARRAAPEVETYAGAALFGKLVFYLPAAAASVSLPLLARVDEREDGARILKRASKLVIGIAALSFTGVALCGQFLAGHLLGPVYARSGPYILISALAVLPYSLVSLFASASLASGRIRLAVASVAAVVVITVAAATGALSLVGFDGLVAFLGAVLIWIAWL